MNKKTLVIGASTNPERYSFLAINMLLQYQHQVQAIGVKSGTVGSVEIHPEQIEVVDLDTVTLYVNPTLQKNYYNYILGLKPKRIIFNPGTENEEFELLAKANGIEALEACTLVLLRTNQY